MSAQSDSLGTPVNSVAQFSHLPPVFRVLLSRVSVAPKTLIAPGPDVGEVSLLIASALTAADHGRLRPWRFISVEGTGRLQLSRCLVEIRRQRRPGIRPPELATTWKKAMCAPTLIAVVAKLARDHPKVPLHEQYISVGAAIHGLMLAAHALGYGAIILSGPRARDPSINALFELKEQEEMIGFISLGTPAKTIPPKHRPAPMDHLQVWQGVRRTKCR